MRNSKVRPLILATALLASTAYADEQTGVQSHNYSGSAGNNSASVSIDPFTFDYFDISLGTLTGVFVSYNIEISGGFIGADNQTNKEVQGTMRLGGGAFFDADMPFLDANFNDIFNTVSGEKQESFTLAADPTLSVGGNGPDTYVMNGDRFSGGVSNVQVNTALNNNFIDSGSFDIDFSSYSILEVNAPGARGFFESPDLNIEMSLYYTYQPDAVIDDPSDATTDVSSPATLGAAGLLMMMAGAFRRKKC